MPLRPSSARFLVPFVAIALVRLAAMGSEISGDRATTGTLLPADRVAGPAFAPASDEAVKMAKGFQLPPGFTASVWASEPLLGNPVAISIDEQGRMFVSETCRLRTSTLDIRHYMFMLEDDLACRTTDDRVASTKRNFPKDWQKLEIESERIQLLEDTDGDGKADKSTVYADGMHGLLDGLNSGVLAYNGKVWCTCIPNVWLFSGLTKDGKAEKRESLSSGYGVRFSFTGHDLHGLILGPDGRLYFSFGDRGAYVKTKEGKTLAFSDEGGVFRCEPDGSHLEAVYRGLRNPEELAFDNHGNLFTGDNDCDQGDRERWVYIVEGGDSGWRVGWQYPMLGVPHNMWMTEHMWEPRARETPYYILSPILNITDGPSGVAYNPGTGLPAEYDDMFFVCSFKGTSATSAIASWKVREEGAGFATDKSPATFVGHVQATDLEFGPDSRLYFTDWGEGWASSGRGRVYRMENAEVRKAQAAQIAEVQALIGGELLKKTSKELATLLGHKDQRIRLRAQWALAEKADAAEQFLKVAAEGAGLARLHGIWGLGHVARLAGYKSAGADAKTVAPLAALLSDKDAEVRAQVVRALGDAKVGGAKVALANALHDGSDRVRFFAAQSLGKLGGADVAAPIVDLLRENADKDEFIRHACVQALIGSGNEQAIVSAARDSSRSVRLAALIAMRRMEKPEIAQFLSDPDPLLVLEAARAINDAGFPAAYRDLAGLIGKPTRDEHLMLRVLNANFRLGTAESAGALAGYAMDDTQPEFLRNEALQLLALWTKPPQRDRIAGVFRPLKERDAAPAVRAFNGTLPKLLASKSEAVALAAVQAVQALGMKDAGAPLLALMPQPQVAAKVRAEALRTLAAFNDPKLLDAIKLAVVDKDPGLRVEASAMLGKLDPAEAARQLGAAFAPAAVAEKKQILDALGALPGPAADQALSGLLGDPGQIPAEAKLELIEAATKRKSPDVKAKLDGYLAAAPGNDPLAKYSFALAGGDADNGERLFTEHVAAQCTRCHRVHGAGGEAGPDLSTVAAKKDRRYILESIVNPNAQIAEGFQTIMVTLANGDIKAGIVKAETAETLTLQMPAPGAAPETVRKADIKLRENAPSGMPPGLADLLSKRDLRDIVEYVASLKN